MSPLTRADFIYPGCLTDNGYFDAPSDYTPMIQSFGNPVVRTDDDAYQGDTYLLLHNRSTTASAYGFLVIGWGSCSGCDALQACDSYAELNDLIDRIENEIRWYDSIEAAALYITSPLLHRTNFYVHGDSWPKFLNQVRCIAAKTPRP